MTEVRNMTTEELIAQLGAELEALEGKLVCVEGSDCGYH